MQQGRLQRWAPLSGVAFVVVAMAGFVTSGSSPDPTDSNAKIASYLADSSNYTKNLVGLFLILAAMLLLIVFYGGLRSRLVEAEGGIGRFGTLAFGAGVASAVFMLVGIIAFTAPVLAAHDAPGNIALDPGLYRVTQDLGYPILVAAVVVGSLAVWSTAAVAFGTGLLPKWFAWFSAVAGVIGLFAIFFFPIFLYFIWIIIASILLYRRPASVAVAPA